MKHSIVIFIVLILSGCASNTIVTENYYDPTNGQVIRTVTTEELTNDASYYKQAANVVIAESKNTCAPHCAPGELGNIEAFRTIRAITGNTFVERGMNAVEAGESLGRTAFNNASLGLLTLGITKVASKSGGVKINGDGNTYSPSEYHSIGNTGNESSYNGPVMPVEEVDNGME